MSESHLPAGVWRFGIFEADLDAGELRKNGVKIHLQGQPFHVLSVLLTHSGKLVSREQLRREVWPQNTFVEFDHALNTAVKKIRCALGDEATAPRYVQTISRRGYRFIADVQAPVDPLQKPVFPLQKEDAVLPATIVQQGSSHAWGFGGRARVTIAVTILLALQLGHRLSTTPTQGPKPVVLAVLPFESLSEDSGLVFVSDGVSQELISQFGRMDPVRLAVAARTSVQPYRHTSKTVTELGRELHADYLMQGSLRGDAQHLRLSAELVRVSDQARIWGDDFDLVGDDMLVAETEIAKSIGAKVRTMVCGSKN